MNGADPDKRGRAVQQTTLARPHPGQWPSQRNNPVRASAERRKEARAKTLVRADDNIVDERREGILANTGKAARVCDNHQRPGLAPRESIMHISGVVGSSKVATPAQATKYYESHQKYMS